VLSAAGIGYRRVAELSGFTSKSVYRLLVGQTRPTAALAEAIMAITVDAGPAERWRDATGTRRRLQGLVSIGWAAKELAARTGSDESFCGQLLHHRVRVQRATAAAVAAVYEELSMLVPAESYGSMRARARGRKRCWFPPLAWDDNVIDEPDALPCLLPPLQPVDRGLELAVQHVVAGHDFEVTQPVRWEIVRRLPDARSSEVAELARCPVKHVSHVRRKLATAC
jgi:hypothetical protein